jgi:hypothetical protein
MLPEDETAFRFDERARLANAWPRYASLLLGVWLFVSAFLWPHSGDAAAASWIMGTSIAMNAFAAIWAASARYFNTVLGLLSLGWHITAAADQSATLVNGAVVSGLVILLSLVPPRRRLAAAR